MSSRDICTDMSNSKTVKNLQTKNKMIVDLFYDTFTMLDDKKSITATIDQADNAELTQVEQVANSTP